MSFSSSLNRVMYAGDDYPDALFQLLDATSQPIDFTSASSITILWVGAKGQFSGLGVPIAPPFLSDGAPGSSYKWNLRYVFAIGDTVAVDTYKPYAQVLWTTGKTQTFSMDNGLQVLATP